MRRHWLNNDPAATHVFNACSLMVPQAERFFINAVRNMMQMQCASQLPADLNRSVKDFLAQEAAHTSQHRQCNAILESFGWTSRAQQAANWFANQAQQRISPLNQLALVCGCEHWTAVIGLHLLEKPQILVAADSGMALLWSWHAAEEIEHRAVCFDLYLAVGGGWLRRVLALPPVTAVCAVIYFWLLFSLLRQDGCLRPSRLMATLRSLFRFFFGQAGMAWAVLRSGLAWLRPSFHPGCEERIPVLEQWINQHQDQFRGV
jgi:uncharacterized protein